MSKKSGNDSTFRERLEDRAIAASEAGKLVCEIEAGAHKLCRVTLGHFTAGNPPLGFSVEIVPDPDPAGSVTTQVVSLGTPDNYRLVLLVSNAGDKPVKARVEQL